MVSTTTSKFRFLSARLSAYDLRDSFSNFIFLKQSGCLAAGIAYLRAGVTTVIKMLEKHELNLEQVKSN